MTPINELRLLAEDLHSAGGHSRYAAALSKAADELGSLERYRTAYNEWVAKTEWVQADTTLPAKYLGMHRADVLKDMISELLDRLEAAEKESDALRAENAALVDDMNLLRNNNTALRTKIAEMENQGPVAHVWRCDNGHVHGSCESELLMGQQLYALPGAKGEKDV